MTLHPYFTSIGLLLIANHTIIAQNPGLHAEEGLDSTLRIVLNVGNGCPYAANMTLLFQSPGGCAVGLSACYGKPGLAFGAELAGTIWKPGDELTVGSEITAMYNAMSGAFANSRPFLFLWPCISFEWAASGRCIFRIHEGLFATLTMHELSGDTYMISPSLHVPVVGYFHTPGVSGAFRIHPSLALAGEIYMLLKSMSLYKAELLSRSSVIARMSISLTLGTVRI